MSAGAAIGSTGATGARTSIAAAAANDGRTVVQANPEDLEVAASRTYTMCEFLLR